MRRRQAEMVKSHYYHCFRCTSPPFSQINPPILVIINGKPSEERDCFLPFSTYLECQSFLILIYFPSLFFHHILYYIFLYFYIYIYLPSPHHASISSPTISSCTFTSPQTSMHLNVFSFFLNILLLLLLLFAAQDSHPHGAIHLSF